MTVIKYEIYEVPTDEIIYKDISSLAAVSTILNNMLARGWNMQYVGYREMSSATA